MKTIFDKHYANQALNQLVTNHDLFDSVKYTLTKEHFEAEGHQWIWETIKKHNAINDEYLDFEILNELAKREKQELLRTVLLETIKTIKETPNTATTFVCNDIVEMAKHQAVKNVITKAVDCVSIGDTEKAIEILKDSKRYEVSKTSNDLFNTDMLDMTQAELEALSKSENLVNDRFLAGGRSLFISADTGVGKSVLMFQLLIMWALGKDVLGFKPHRPITSLYIGDEDDAFDIQHFFKSVKAMAGLTDNEIKTAINRISIPNTYDSDSIDPFELIESKLRAKKYDIVVINPMSNFISEDLNTSTAAQTFHGKIHRLELLYKVQFIVVGHNNKPRNNSTTEKSSVYSFAGNAGFANKFRARINLVRIGESNTFNLVISKGAKKAGFTEKLIKHNDINTDYFYWLECQGSKGVNLKTTELNHTETNIYNLLTGEPMTITEIADRLNVHKTYINRNITTLKVKRPNVGSVEDVNNKQRILYYKIEDVD
jgi:hypothetical protein